MNQPFVNHLTWKEKESLQAVRFWLHGSDY